jgi:hypothetical protein
MADDRLTKLQATDIALLTEVVRQDQRSPAFEISDWSVHRLSDQGVANPNGLWLFSGQGQDAAGTRPWSVAAKVFDWPPDEGDLSNFGYWKREVLAAQSELLANLAPGLRAPRIYLTEEGAPGAALWMEHVRARYPGRWSLPTFAQAARLLGRWHGRSAQATVPNQPWFARSHFRTFLSWVNGDEDLESPLCAQHIPQADRTRYERLWAEREKLFIALEEMPHIFSHFDCHRRNIIGSSDENGQDEFVLIDWGLCGLGPLGADLAPMIGFTAIALDWPPSQVRELEAAAFPAYIQGLRDAGWTGDETAVRFGYAAWLAAGIGCAMPAGIRWWCSAEYRESALTAFGVAELDLLPYYLHILNFTLDRADEAFRYLSAPATKSNRHG